MAKISDEDVYESLSTQLDELGEIAEGETVILVKPAGCTDEQYDRVMKKIESEG